MQVVAGSTFTTSLIDPAPSGLYTYLGARVEVPVTRAIVSYWRAASLVDGVWTVELDSPLSVGEYLLVWRDGGPEPPVFEVFLPLVAVASVEAVASPPTVDVDAVTPTSEEVALLERTRTATGGGGDTEFVGPTEFDENSRPSDMEVDSLIVQARGLVLAELPRAFPDDHYEAVKQAVCLYTALLIEVSFFREQAGQGAVEFWRDLYVSAITSLKENIEKDLAQWRLLRRMEPWPLPSSRVIA